jgi:hypothetical protein
MSFPLMACFLVQTQNSFLGCIVPFSAIFNEERCYRLAHVTSLYAKPEAANCYLGGEEVRA